MVGGVAVVGENKDIADRLKFLQNAVGAISGPFDSFLALRGIHESGVSILLIEQNVAKALEVAQRAYVLEGGRIVTEGAPAALLAQPHIREAYLGEGV